jgi:two-component sensor histidine kinase/putative methionine-R-sulfoxide reductase with GAF domain
MTETRTIEKLLRQQAALANFGSFAFREADLQKILTEAARICAQSLTVPFAKVCRYRAAQNDLMVEAGCGWHPGVIGCVVSRADESTTQGRAFVTGEPVILEDLSKSKNYTLPPFYAEHGIVATADVLIKGRGEPWGVLEVDSPIVRAFDQHDIDFLTGFANVVAEAVATAGRIAVMREAVEQMGQLIIEKDRLLAERQSLIAEKDSLLAGRQILLDEKEVLAEELQHRVRNNLQLILGMLNRQLDLSDESGKEGLRAIARRVMSLAKIYDHLLGHGLTRSIDFNAYLGGLCDSLRDFQDGRDVGVTLVYSGASRPLPLDMDAVTTLGIIASELISNAYLHAFPDRAGKIHVSLKQSATDAVLTIGDDGIGFVESASSKRHGLGLVRRLIEQVGGAVRVDSHPGTEWTLGFPTAA